MRRTTRILAAAVVLLLVASAALAFYEIEADRLDAVGGVGTAIIHVAGNVYAQVTYLDADQNGHYSEGDTRLRTVYFRV